MKQLGPLRREFSPECTGKGLEVPVDDVGNGFRSPPAHEQPFGQVLLVHSEGDAVQTAFYPTRAQVVVQIDDVVERDGSQGRQNLLGGFVDGVNDIHQFTETGHDRPHAGFGQEVNFERPVKGFPHSLYCRCSQENIPNGTESDEENPGLAHWLQFTVQRLPSRRHAMDRHTHPSLPTQIRCGSEPGHGPLCRIGRSPAAAAEH